MIEGKSQIYSASQNKKSIIIRHICIIRVPFSFQMCLGSF